MTGWFTFAIAFAAFFAAHSGPLLSPVRAAGLRVLGPALFWCCYGLLSLATLIWLLHAAGRAPYIEVWPPASWHKHAALTIMLPVCLIIALSIGYPNPLSFGGARNTAFDPRRPGLVRWMRHPVLWAMTLWATAHLLANGDLAHVLLFGVFALFSLLGLRRMDARRKGMLGDDWQTLLQQINTTPLWLRFSTARALPIRLAIGVLLYGALITLHPVVLGVSPLP